MNLDSEGIVFDPFDTAKVYKLDQTQYKQNICPNVSIFDKFGIATGGDMLNSFLYQNKEHRDT